MSSELRVDKIVPTDGVPTGGGGGIVQVKQFTLTNTANGGFLMSTSSSSFTATPLLLAITPKFSTSKVLVLVHQTYQIDNGSNDVQFQINMLLRDGSNNTLHGGLGYNALRWKNMISASNVYSLNFLHSPNTTSAFTYKMTMNYYYMSSGSGTLKAQRDDQANTQSEMTLMEVSA